MRIAFLSPFQNETNEYIDIQKKTLNECGFTVMPLNIGTITSKSIIQIFNRKNILVYHWIENRAFKKRRGVSIISILGLIQWLTYATLNILTPAKKIYFIHNHAAHDTSGTAKEFSKWLINIFSSTATHRIVHDSSFCDTYKAKYIPHPLYSEEALVNTHASKKIDSHSKLTYGILGAIRPYKRIEEILQNWPAEEKLLIRGKGEDVYTAKLFSIIQNKNLGPSIDLRSEFLKKNDFKTILSELDAIIFAHESGSMLVSGAFFEAIGLVPIIIARKSPFFEKMANKFPSIYLFSEPEEIPGLIKRIKHETTENSLHPKSEAVIEEFGQKTCSTYYKKILNS